MEVPKASLLALSMARRPKTPPLIHVQSPQPLIGSASNSRDAPPAQTKQKSTRRGTRKRSDLTPSPPRVEESPASKKSAYASRRPGITLAGLSSGSRSHSRSPSRFPASRSLGPVLPAPQVLPAGPSLRKGVRANTQPPQVSQVQQSSNPRATQRSNMSDEMPT